MLKIKKKKVWIAALALLALAIIFIGRLYLKPDNTHTVKSGYFELSLNTKGEINGKNAVVINLPDELKKRNLRIWNIKIKDLVAEGTIVQKGEWVATLDAAAINQKMQENNQDLEKRRAELNDAKIDSAIQLTKLREELQEFSYDLEYKKLELEQAKYESPAYQRKKQVEFNKTLRNMDKKRRDYKLRQLQLKTKTKRIEDYLNYFQERQEMLQMGLMACRVKAPKSGMVMYAKQWGGRKISVGDEISRWNPAIATLPDMSVLVSETYIQEIDITKIALGDSVEIKIDALPDNTYSGKIAAIANIGQELQGFDTKVFKILIDMNENGKELKPAMTTNNRIIISQLENVLKIPRKYLFGNNADNYVFLQKNGKIWKKKVTVGPENEEEIIINSGLNENDKIYTSIPENADKIEFLEN